MKKIQIFCDGACKGNPGRGGWGAILRFEGVEKELSGFEPLTTNNRMELQAVIAALAVLKEPCDITVISDSQYVSKGMSEWIHDWKKRGWKTASKKPVLNQDLWTELDRLCSMHKAAWVWVKGHSGHPENERCDQLANQAIDANSL